MKQMARLGRKMKKKKKKKGQRVQTLLQQTKENYGRKVTKLRRKRKYVLRNTDYQEKETTMRRRRRT